MMYGLEDAIEALYCLSPECSYEKWSTIAMAAKDAGISHVDFDRWSQSGSTYNEAVTKKLWSGIKPDKGISAGTLFYEARRHGWQPTAQRTCKPGPTHFDSDSARDCSPADLFARCEPATSGHPYIRLKRAEGMQLEQLRVVPDDMRLTIRGESMAGALVVPVMRGNGSISSLQFITTGETARRLKACGASSKLNLPGHSVDGWFTVGAFTAGGTVYLCEGIGTAWASHRATGHASVCCFGWGRVQRVAKQLRSLDPSARLVIVPDVGKEEQASQVARETDALVVTLPSGWSPNSDVFDFAEEAGIEALERLLESAATPQVEQHPLANFVAIDLEVRQPRWVVQGLIAEGLVLIAGEPGIGKTSALIPLSMIVSHLCEPENPLRPTHWRHVIYVSEDIQQVQRLIAGLLKQTGAEVSEVELRERFHLVAASRLPPQEIVKVAQTYRKNFSRTVQGVELLPLVVLDTRSAVVSLENEDDNARASEAVAALKQNFEGIPIWVIGHLPKANAGRSDLRTLTVRGASAWEGDANQILFVVSDKGNRALMLGKRRFESAWPIVPISTKSTELSAIDEFGVATSMTLSWGVPSPQVGSSGNHTDGREQAGRLSPEDVIRADVMTVVRLASEQGNPLNREGIKRALCRKTEDVVRAVNHLKGEGWLYEVHIPSMQRTNSRRSSFFIALMPDEREKVMKGLQLPPERVAIPPSMRKGGASD
jgi:hypothetical protein